MLVCQLWIGIEQHRNHCEVARDAIGEVFVESFEFVSSLRIQRLRGDVLWNLRVSVVRAHRTQLVLETLCVGVFTSGTATI